MGKIDIETVTDREILKGAVQKEMFCRVSGQCLDVKSAVLIEASKAGALTMSLVVSAASFDEVVKGNVEDTLAKHPGTTLKIYDGRQLF